MFEAEHDFIIEKIKHEKLKNEENLINDFLAQKEDNALGLNRKKDELQTKYANIEQKDYFTVLDILSKAYGVFEDFNNQVAYVISYTKNLMDDKISSEVEREEEERERELQKKREEERKRQEEIMRIQKEEQKKIDEEKRIENEKKRKKERRRELLKKIVIRAIVGAIIGIIGAIICNENCITYDEGAVVVGWVFAIIGGILGLIGGGLLGLFLGGAIVGLVFAGVSVPFILFAWEIELPFISVAISIVFFEILGVLWDWNNNN